jgi:hypothetical protein
MLAAQHRACDHGQRIAQELRARRGGARHRPRGRRGRDRRLPGPQRGRQDDDARDPGRTPPTRLGRGRRARVRPRSRPARLSRAHRHRAPGDRRRAGAHGVRDDRPPLRRVSTSASRRRSDRIGGPRGAAQRARQLPVRWPAATPGPGDWDRRGPPAAVPRRAHHRLRPIGTAAVVGLDPPPPFPRQDDPADHPLHGGGPAAGRPRGGHRRRADRRRGDAEGPVRGPADGDHVPHARWPRHPRD